MRYQPLTVAAILFACLVSSASAARPDTCYWDGGNSGCDVSAYYDESEDVTYYDNFCHSGPNQGQHYYGQMNGDQVPAVCGGY